MNDAELKEFLYSERKNTLEELEELTKRENTTNWGIEDEELRFRLSTKYEILTEIIRICLARNRF